MRVHLHIPNMYRDSTIVSLFRGRCLFHRLEVHLGLLDPVNCPRVARFDNIISPCDYQRGELG